MSGKFNSANSVVISVAKAKAVGKKHSATLNDTMLAITAKALKRHFESMGDSTDTITAAVPWSYHDTTSKRDEDGDQNEVPTDPEYSFSSQFATVPVYLKLTDDFSAGIAEVKETMDNLKASFIPMASFAALQLSNILSSQASTADSYSDSGRKHTLFFSNVPGFLKPVKYSGENARRMFCLGSGSGGVSTAMTMVSIDKRMQMNLTADEYMIEDVEGFMSLINEEIGALGMEYEYLGEGFD